MSVTATEPTIGFALSAAIAIMADDMKRQQDEADLAARVQCAFQLARSVAPLLGRGERDVWDALIYVPDDHLSLLDSPNGWTMLVSIVAAEFGLVSPLYRPSIH